MPWMIPSICSLKESSVVYKIFNIVEEKIKIWRIR